MVHLLFNCPENIKSHPKTVKGNHCLSCNKEVIDFSNYSAAEIRNHFKKLPEKTCGTFNRKQIEAPLNATLASLFRFAFALVFLMGVNSQQLFSQENQDTTKFNSAKTNGILVSGQIMSNHEPLPFVRVQLYAGHNLIGLAMADNKGNYQITIPDSLAYSDLRLSFRFVGFVTHDVLFNPHGQLAISINPELNQLNEMITGIVIIEHPNLMTKDPADFGKTTIKGEDLKHRQR